MICIHLNIAYLNTKKFSGHIILLFIILPLIIVPVNYNINILLAQDCSEDICITHPDQIQKVSGKFKFNLQDNDEFRYSDYHDDNWNKMSVPGQWLHEGIQHDNPAWYRIHFKLCQVCQKQKFAIMLPYTLTAYEVFVNGQMIGSLGAIGSDSSKSKQRIRVSMFDVPQELLLTKNVLALRVQPFRHKGGMALEDFYIGSYHQIFDQSNNSNILVHFNNPCCHRKKIWCQNYSNRAYRIFFGYPQ